MAKLNNMEERRLSEIASWKAQSPGIISRATGFLSRPLQWVGENVIPDAVSEQANKANEMIIEKLQDAANWTVKPEDVLRQANELGIQAASITALRTSSVFDLSTIAEEAGRKNAQLAAVGGFGTGLAGWPGLIADLPALFMLSWRSIYQIALSYGYDWRQDNEEDRSYEINYMLRVFQIATATQGVEKHEGLLALRQMEDDHEMSLRSRVGNHYSTTQLGRGFSIQISKAIVGMIIKQTVARKAITMLPGLGAVLTAGFNYTYVKDVAECANYLYQERLLLDKKGRKTLIDIQID